MSWPTVALNEICSTQYGYTATAQAENIGPKFLRITDVVKPSIDWSTVPSCEIDDTLVGKYRLERGDIVVARTGYPGYAKLIRDDVESIFASYLVRIKLDRSVADPGYVGRLLESSRYRTFVNSVTTGTAQANANAKKLALFRFPLPPLETQGNIAGILSAYDDLIENNRRRIQLLEQAARLLFKEWFVHLRYPGHEHATISAGVPERWEKVPISSFCTVGRGGSPRPIKDYMDGTVPWFKIGDATASGSPFVFSTSELLLEDGVKKSVLLPPHELILSNSATCGIPYFTGVSGCIHDGWLYFKELARVSKWFLYCCLFAKQREILMGIGEGATQKNLNTNYVGRQIVLLPKDQGLLDDFTNVIEPLFDQIFTLAQANISLIEAHDLLLPRLMNGEVAV